MEAESRFLKCSPSPVIVHEPKHFAAGLVFRWRTNTGLAYTGIFFFFP